MSLWGAVNRTRANWVWERQGLEGRKETEDITEMKNSGRRSHPRVKEKAYCMVAKPPFLGQFREFNASLMRIHFLPPGDMHSFFYVGLFFAIGINLHSISNSISLGVILTSS